MFIKPIKHSSYTLGRFAKHEDIAVSENQLFRLQKRKRPSDSSASYNYRIITRGNPYYEIAVSNDLNQLKEREWRYITEEIPNRLPQNLHEKGLMSWITSHFTCLAMEIGGIDADTIDDDNGYDGNNKTNQQTPSDAKTAALSVYNRNLANGTGNHSVNNLIPITTWQLHGIMPFFIAMALTNTPILFLRESSSTTFTFTLVVWNLVLLCVIFFGYPAFIGISKLGTISQLAPKQARRHQRLLDLNYSDSDDEDDVVGVGGIAGDGMDGDLATAAPKPAPNSIEALQGGGPTQVTAKGITPGCSLRCSDQGSTPEELVNSYSDPQGESFSLRCGPDYKYNKLKAPSSSSLFDLVGLDVFQSKTKIKHIAKHVDIERIYSLTPAPYVSLGTEIDAELSVEIAKQTASPLKHVIDMQKQRQLEEQQGITPSPIPRVYPDVTTIPDPRPIPFGEHLPGFHFGTMEKPFIFFITMQLPTYEPSFMASGDQDGPGMCLVWYLRAKPETQRDLMRDEPVCPAIRVLKQFVLIEPTNPKYEEWMNRMKTIPRLVNHDEFEFNWTLKGLVKKYNAKPFLTRPQHTFHRGPGYFNYDLDIHNFCYTARKVLYSFLDKIDRVVLDWGFTIEAFDDDEQPEVMLGQMRVYKIQYQQFPSWEATVEALEKAKRNPSAVQQQQHPASSASTPSSSQNASGMGATTTTTGTSTTTAAAATVPTPNSTMTNSSNANSPRLVTSPKTKK